MLLSAAFRAKARAALQNHWQTALLIALIVNLPSLLVQGIAAFTNNDLNGRLSELAYRASLSAEAMNAFQDSVGELLSDSGIWTVAALGFLAWLVTPALSLGMNHWTLERLRGVDLPVSSVFSRLRIFLKGIGLRLFVSLKVLIWTLPGVALSLLSLIPLFRADPAVSESLISAVSMSMNGMYAGMILALVLGIMGFLYYAVADFILADEPEERILSAARRSKDMMKGRRGALMSLLLSFVLWHLLIVLVSSFIAGITGTVIALMLQMLGSLFLNAYKLAAQGAFFEALRQAPVQEITFSSPGGLSE